MSSTQCEFCEATLSNHSSMIRHQKNTRSCLRLQGKPVVEPERIKTTIEKCPPCPGCLRVITKRYRYQKHLDSCRLNLQRRELQEAHQEEISKLRVELRELREELGREMRDHEITKAKLEVHSDLTARSASAPKNVTNNISLAELTKEVGSLLADKITKKEFWQGQGAIGKQLRSLRDEEDHPFYRVKDESRMKLEIKHEGSIRRDDRAEFLIETVQSPVREKIVTIKDNLIGASKGKRTGFEELVVGQALDCMEFTDGRRNTRFLQSVSVKLDT